MRTFPISLCIFYLATMFMDPACPAQKNEELVLHKIDEQNGLSDNNVQCIYKDTRDFVWIGTASGLNLMDGSDITVFRHDAGVPASISNNNITSITGDRSGLIWIGTPGGVNSFDPVTRKFRFFPLRDDAELKNEPVTGLQCDSSGGVYVGTLEGLFYLDATRGMKRLPVPGAPGHTAASNGITCLSKDRSGTLWITTYDGLWSYDGRHFMHEVSRKNDPGFTGLFTCCTVDHAGKIWIGTWDKGLKMFDPGTGRVSTFSVNDNEDIASLAEIRQPDGGFLIWINGYFQAFDPVRRMVVRLPVPPAFAKAPLVNDLYTSNDNWLWIGTHQGLYYYNPDKSLFRQHRFTAPVTTQVVALLQWKDKLLVSGSGSHFLKAYDTAFRVREDYSRPFRNQDLSCLCLRFSGANRVKAGTSKGMVDIDLSTGRTDLHHLDFLSRNIISGNFITSLLEDSQHDWWVFPWRYGIWKTDSNYHHFRQVFDNFTTVNNRPKPLVVADAMEDPHHNLWFADLDEGIIFFNRQQNRFSRPFARVMGDRVALTQILYYHHLCFSFAGAEVYVWNPDSMRLRKINLPFQNDKPISSIAIDSSQTLWMATKKGLMAYSLVKGTFERFTTADGLITNEMDATLLCTTTGTMVMGSPDYLSSFVPSRLLSSIDQRPHLLLTGITANGRPVTSKNTGAMTFPHTVNNFIFRWTVTDYNNPVNNRFYYRLKGIDKTWRSAGNHGEVEFANLSSGSYDLELRGENSNGVAAARILTVHFEILLPFWRTWWFLVLLFLSIALFFYSLYRYRLKQALQIEKLRNRISLDLHDDIGSTLSSISILSEMALQESRPSQAKEMVHEIKENSLSLMERMDDIVWSINPQNDSLESLFLRIRAFASRLFEAREINYSIHIDDKIRQAQLKMEYRQHIYMILKEAINNLVKYAACTTATIEVEHAGAQLTMRVRDNGKGFDPATARRGNGLYSMRQRAREMNGTLAITSAPGEGTTVILSLKIK